MTSFRYGKAKRKSIERLSDAAYQPGRLRRQLIFVTLPGNFAVQPNPPVVPQLFGLYGGAVKDAGLRWCNPFEWKKKVSLRVCDLETNHLKVNDHDGNPIETAALVVWRVVDSAEATFQVDDDSHYVTMIPSGGSWHGG